MKYNLIFYGIGFIILMFTNSWVNIQNSKNSDYQLSTFNRCLEIQKSNNGDLNTCIALRTALIKNNYIYVQAGAGIVADSKPINEFKETENKALAILTACSYANNFK